MGKRHVQCLASGVEVVSSSVLAVLPDVVAEKAVWIHSLGCAGNLLGGATIPQQLPIVDASVVCRRSHLSSSESMSSCLRITCVTINKDTVVPSVYICQLKLHIPKESLTSLKSSQKNLLTFDPIYPTRILLDSDTAGLGDC